MPLIYETPVTLPKSPQEGGLHTTIEVQTKVKTDVSYFLQVYETPGTIIAKIVDKTEADREIARVHLGLAEELKSSHIYYPIRSDVIEGYQRSGIGTFLYDMLIQYLWNKDILLVSGALNTASKGLWEKLRTQGRVYDRAPYMGYKYAMEALPKEDF